MKQQPPTHSYEYAALRYLQLWEQSERSIHALMSKEPTTAALRKAMHYFRVSRSFRGIAEDAVARSVLSALKDASKEAEASSPENAVSTLASRFAADFEQTNLSAASKLLWFTHRRPYVILDARASSALSSLGHKFSKRDYAGYSAAWRQEYRKHKDAVAEAVGQLRSLQPFFSAWHASEASIDRLARSPWFRERVFDLYLWQRGKASADRSLELAT